MSDKTVCEIAADVVKNEFETWTYSSTVAGKILTPLLVKSYHTDELEKFARTCIEEGMKYQRHETGHDGAFENGRSFCNAERKEWSKT